MPSPSLGGGWALGVRGTRSNLNGNRRTNTSPRDSFCSIRFFFAPYDVYTVYIIHIYACSTYIVIYRYMRCLSATWIIIYILYYRTRWYYFIQPRQDDRLLYIIWPLPPLRFIREYILYMIFYKFINSHCSVEA